LGQAGLLAGLQRLTPDVLLIHSEGEKKKQDGASSTLSQPGILDSQAKENGYSFSN